ncbi:hypothetical protein FJZ31_29045 [Candidatus Poribacteria bacterium]|nr:hypothetical protein [Candidatus Poribacteria bacterium]
MNILKLTLYCLIVLLFVSCAYAPKIARPVQDTPEDTWKAYYLDQFKAFKDKAPAPPSNASQAEWAGYNKAQEEWRKIQLEEETKAMMYQMLMSGFWWTQWFLIY